jgi:predicted anti-sigma-YlaC factor YlaD
MKHLSEEQIVLHYYGDAEGEPEIREHLAACSSCRDEFDRVKALLGSLAPVEVPDPPAFYEEKTWLNLRDRLPQHAAHRRLWASPPRWAIAGLTAVLIVAAFLAGRFWPRHEPATPAATVAANPQRVVLIAVGGHLQRSQMLLVEIMNADAKGTVNLSTEQQQARDLLDANHLYRASAQRDGDPQVARLLDQLGRVLAEIANGPSELSPADLQQIRGRIQSEGLLFKVRVVGSEVNSRVRRQEQNPAANSTQRL